MANRIYSRSNNTTTLTGTRIIDDLQNEADRMLDNFRAQLAKEITNQMLQLNQDSANAGVIASAGGSDDSPSTSSYTALLSSAVKYLIRPSVSRSTVESSRSVAAQQEFRLSQSQAAAQAATALAKGQKNS